MVPSAKEPDVHSAVARMPAVTGPPPAKPEAKKPSDNKKTSFGMPAVEALEKPKPKPPADKPSDNKKTSFGLPAVSVDEPDIPAPAAAPSVPEPEVGGVGSDPSEPILFDLDEGVDVKMLALALAHVLVSKGVVSSDELSEIVAAYRSKESK